LDGTVTVKGMSLNFSTKAGTLAILKTVLKSARIAPLFTCTVGQWEADYSACIRKIITTLGPGPWIVRSSCGLEDGVTKSNAGLFVSISNVDSADLRWLFLRSLSLMEELIRLMKF